MEGTRERKRGRKGATARHQWTELPEWWIRSVYMCRPVLVRASLGETWEASCLCRSAKQKEPLTTHPHISYFSFVPFFWFCLFFNILYSTKLLTASTAAFGFNINQEGNGHIRLMWFARVSFHSKFISISTEKDTIVQIMHTYTFRLLNSAFSAFGLNADKDENSIYLPP